MKPWERFQNAVAAPPEEGPWTKFQPAEEEAPEVLPDRGMAALEGFGQAASFGYLPNLQAVVERSTPDSNAELDARLEREGFTIDQPRRTYVDMRDENIARHAEYAEKVPEAYYAGQAGGLIATAPAVGRLLSKLPGLTKAAQGLIGRATQSAAGGGLIAAAQNPGDVPGVLDPYQTDRRLENAKTGALIGGVAQVGTEGIKRGAELIKSAPSKLKSAAEAKAFKSSGAMLKDFRKAHSRGRVGDLGSEMLKSGMVGAGSTFDDVAAKSGSLKQEVGNKIGEIYKRVGGANVIKTDPNQLGTRLTAAVSEAQPNLGAQAYAEAMEAKIAEIVGKGQQLNDVRLVNDIIGELDDVINYSKRANELPAVQQGYIKLRQALRAHVNEAVENTGRAFNDPAMSAELRALNKRYGNLTEINSIARDRVSRESANQMFSLTDKIAGVGGAASGAVAGAALSGDIEGALKGGLVGSGLGLLNKGARQYGAPILTQAAHKAGGLLERVPSVVTGPTAKIAGSLAQSPAVLGPSVNRALQQSGELPSDRPDQVPGTKLMKKEVNRKPAKKKKKNAK